MADRIPLSIGFFPSLAKNAEYWLASFITWISNVISVGISIGCPSFEFDSDNERSRFDQYFSYIIFCSLLCIKSIWFIDPMANERCFKVEPISFEIQLCGHHQNCIGDLISTSLFILVTSNIEEDMKLESAMGGGGLLVNREKEAQEKRERKKKKREREKGKKWGNQTLRCWLRHTSADGWETSDGGVGGVDGDFWPPCPMVAMEEAKYLVTTDQHSITIEIPVGFRNSWNLIWLVVCSWRIHWFDAPSTVFNYHHQIRCC